MKTLHIVARNHMDPTWLRCFTDHYTHPTTGETVRPYADIEELQILEYMDFAERYGVHYHIEQSVVVKKFLERNPDQKKRFYALVKNGLFELAGGGEAVIDCNMTQGESWARNHLYSRSYYAREFDHAPRYAITPDIFGLPSQLPQFFRSLGYDALIIFDRVMLANKPFWQGLDGTKIVLDSKFLQPPLPTPRSADCVKLRACHACMGEGCPVCSGTGIDMSYDMTRPDKELEQQSYYGNVSADELIENLLQEDKDTYFVMITTEETRVGDHLYGALEAAAKRHDMVIKYTGFEENHDWWCAGQVDRLRAGDTPEEDTDLRPEGNPISCGSYSARIFIKQQNRKLEDELLSAERLAVMAKMLGGWQENATPRRDFPKEKIEHLWNKMALVQFHDSVPGSHCDASNAELRRWIREIRNGAYQIARDAEREMLRYIDHSLPASLSESDGYRPLVYFNTDTEPKALPELVIQAPAGTAFAEVRDENGKPVCVSDPQITPERVGVFLVFTVEAPVPPMGWRLFFWRPAEAPATKVTQADRMPLQMENEFFRVTVDDARITSIYDKKNGCMALKEDAGGIAIGVDIGSPWGRALPESDHVKLHAVSAALEESPAYSRLTLKGGFSDRSRNINSLSFVQTVTLRRGEPLVRFHTAIDWDGHNTRVHAEFPLADDAGDTLYCEVPFGTMARGKIEPVDLMGIVDEWPTLGFAGVHTQNHYNVAVLKGGIPGVKLVDNEISMSLFRAFDYDDPTYAGANDIGKHEFDYAITTWKGSFADGHCCARAASYNTPCWSTPALDTAGVPLSGEAKTQKPVQHSGRVLAELFDVLPKNLRTSALKLSEDGHDVILRLFEGDGIKTTLMLHENIGLIPCNTLEVPLADGEMVHSYTFRPFEIATFRLKLKADACTEM